MISLVSGCPAQRLVRSRLWTAWAAALLALTLGACGGDNAGDLPARSGEEVGGSMLTCELTFATQSEGPFNSLSWQVDYGRAPGYFVRDNGRPDCRSLLSVPSYAALQCMGEGCRGGDDRKLEMGLSTNGAQAELTGFSGPTRLLQCRFYAEREPAATDFDLRLKGAAGPSLHRYDDLSTIDVHVSSLDCHGSQDGGPASSSTTTTAPSVCADMVCDKTEACVDGLCVKPPLWAVDFRLVDAIDLGSLQFKVEWTSGLAAGFVAVGDRTGVWCDMAPDVVAMYAAALHEQHLEVGFMALDGISGPTDLLTCYMESVTEPLTPAALSITVLDAADTDLVTSYPFPTIEVSALREILP